MTMSNGKIAEMLSNRIDNIPVHGYKLNTQKFRKGLKLINPYEDVLEGKRTLKDMAEYGYDKNDFQAMRIFRYNLMKKSLKVNTLLDLLITIMNIISFYLIIVFGSLNVNFVNKVFSWIAHKPIENTLLFNIPVLNNINFFIGFSIFYLSMIILIELFKTRISNLTSSEFFYYSDFKSSISSVGLTAHAFFTVGLLVVQTFLFLSYLFDIALYFGYTDKIIHLQNFSLIYSGIGVIVAILFNIYINKYLNHLQSLFKKIENVIDTNGITPSSPLTEELIQKHKFMIYNDKNIQNDRVKHKTTTTSKCSDDNIIKPTRKNIIEITPEHIIKKRQQEIQEEKNVSKEKEETKVININKVKRRARF